ncbi:hypothetical protein HUJ05_009053 [Dendroctonus ponderosae]|nr:hypothetical protein HUJ05_009053 [Dendroctonus ponderosae]
MKLCQFCEKSYYHRQNLDRHKKYYWYRVRKENICGICGKRYVHANSLWRHQKYECNKKKSFFCDFCPAAFYQKTHLQRNYITKPKKFGCNCGKSFSHSTSYYRHKKKECQKERARLAVMYKCSKCQKGFKYQPNLCRHQRFECNKVRSFSCPYCDYAAYQKSHLKTHVHRRHQEFFYTFEAMFGNRSLTAKDVF